MNDINYNELIDTYEKKRKELLTKAFDIENGITSEDRIEAFDQSMNCYEILKVLHKDRDRNK